MTLVLATVRESAAGFIESLIFVYSILILAYIVSSLVLSFGVRIPYARWSDALLTFLRDVSEPYLRIFRRFIPPMGPLDLSPIAALFVLYIVGGIVVALVRG